MSAQSNDQETGKDPSTEEIAALNQKMIEFWNIQIPVLRVQKEYETLMADVEESRYKRAVMLRRRAELNAPASKDPSKEKENSNQQ